MHLSDRWLRRSLGAPPALSQCLNREARYRLSRVRSQDQGQQSTPLHFEVLKLDRGATVGRLATESSARKIPGPHPQPWGGDRSDPYR